MAAKLIHLHNSTAGLVPSTTELVVGQIAINAADKKIFILGADNSIATFYSGANGTVTSVNGVSPSSGNVALTPTNLGATTVGNALFTAANQSAALNTLGGTSVGIGVFTAATTAAVQTAIGATATGSALLTAASASAALTTLGGVATSSVGAANGVAPLDSGSKIPVSYLPASIVGAVQYQGTFVPGTSTLPAAASGNQGWYYIATAAGTYSPPGTGQPALTFSTGDWLISNGTVWGTVESSALVSSVNGKTGTVVLGAADITTGTFAAAQLGSGAGNGDVLTTNGSGAPTWVSTLSAAQEGAGAAANSVLTTNASNVPTWVTTVPTANLPVGSAAALGLAQAGSGLSVAGGVFSVNTSVLTLDEGTYSGT
ncbi:tail protein [Burkholderia phage BcepSaruman]|uniref:Uncharacterized protein n=1 Tax=Burkholderia phage BcepSaruman TaxID=2530032 RepID=A0A4D5ZDP2_9CAUD|nr:tail protein [Burkholderia phage BcepSaruman]QBX06686.1 hypothetical protein BcepSaruman_273 [Burkholderia phage BcepSaruman]